MMTTNQRGTRNAERGTGSRLTVCRSEFRVPSSAFCLLLLALLVLAPGMLLGQSVNVDDLRRKQETQQRAAELAGELVKNLLDVQLQQLEENGLAERPLYQDVKTMRANIDGLIEAEMAEVVGLLSQAQADGNKDRDALFIAARTKISDVLARLLSERQNLSRRLRTAELASQVRRLIDVETIVRDVTVTLPNQTREMRETQQLATLADQRDARKLFDKVTETLTEAKAWGGEIGRTAVDGLALLKAAETSSHIDLAAVGLETGDFTNATEHETAVIRGLQVLLKKVKETQGLIEADHRAALEAVREMIRRQDELATATKEMKPEDPAAEDLLAKQSAFGKDLAQLNDMLLDKPNAVPLVERAQKASEAAVVELFQQKPTEAMKSQTTTRASLETVEKLLMEDDASLPEDRSAEQLAERAKDLEKVRDALKQARADVAPHNKPEAKTGAEAKKALEKAAKDTANAGHERDLPAAVDAKLRDAARAARDAAKMQDAANTDEAKKKEATAKTDAALEAAQAEVEAALADTKRIAPAVAAAELSRAAEALDRAAAAEREVAKQATAEAKKPEADPQVTAALQEEQKNAKQVADEAAKATAALAPETQQPLAEAKAAVDEAMKKLTPPADKPTPAAADLKQAAQQAEKAASKLAQAAQQLRRQAQIQAQKLAAEAEKQIAQVKPVAAAVEKQAEAASEKSQADAEAALAAAEEQVRKAEAEQMKAAGKKEAAAAKELSEKIEQAAMQQRTAQAAAEEQARRGEETPLDAITAQQKTADAVEQVMKEAAARPKAKEAAAKNMPDPLGDQLEMARQAAQQAARELLDGKKQEAAQSRKEAMDALAQAAETAKSEEKTAAEAPAGKPDAEAQAKVTESAAEAKKLAQMHAPEAAAALDAAEKASMQAQQAAAKANGEMPKPEGTKPDATKPEATKPDGTKPEAPIQLAQAPDAKPQPNAGQNSDATKPDATKPDGAKPDGAKPPIPADGATKPEQTAANDATKPAAAPADPAAAKAAAEAQDATAKNLAKAKEQLAQARAKLAAQQQQQMAQQAQTAAKLAEQAVPLEPTATQALREAQQSAQQAAAPQPTPQAAQAAEKRTEQAMQRAAAGLAAREQVLRRDQALAQAMMQGLAQQQQAAQEIAQNKMELAQASTPPATPPQPNQNGQQPAPPADAAAAANKLNTAMQNFAQAAQVTGQAAQEISGQQQLANEALAEALDAASQLTPPQTGDMAHTPPQGNSPSQTAASQAPSGMPSQPPQAQMGKGLTPASPEATAQMMAGQQALEQMQQAQAPSPKPAGASPGPVPNAPGQPTGQPAPSEVASNAPQEQSPQTAQNKESGGVFVNDGKKTAADAGLAKLAETKEDPWIAKLPAELRNAIRAEAQRPAPKGYEERLRNYFKNIE